MLRLVALWVLKLQIRTNYRYIYNLESNRAARASRVAGKK